MKILCKTKFDCTYTGVTGHFRPGEIPFRDQAGQTVGSQDDWNHSRNQQRNWETLMQIIGLRTQPLSITRPVCKDGIWEFEFVNESENVFGLPGNEDSFVSLKRDCEGVPMIVNLNEESELEPIIVASGADQNIWFESINNILD
jgi:hypothetical protein